MRIVILWEKGLPFADSAPIRRRALDEAAGGRAVFASQGQLPAALRRWPALLVTPNGSAFPKGAWGAIRSHLERGGFWLNLGGAPLSRPARRRGRSWRLECPQTAYGKEVLLNHAFEAAIPAGAELRSLRPELDLSPLLAGLRLDRAWALQFRFGRRREYPQEHGSTSPREAVARSLVHALVDGQQIAAPVLAVDRIAGPCAGSRWVFAACQARAPLPVELIARLIEYASRPAVQLEVIPSYACYRPGERAAVRLEASCRRKTAIRVSLRVEHEGRPVAASDLALSAGPGERAGAVLAATLRPKAPGLYIATATAWEKGSGPSAEPVAFARNAFWVRDAGLLERQEPLTVNRDYFLRGGKVFPVTGSTYMCGRKHRHFLFEPDPAQWEEDFAAMQAAGVNMVRTGIWTGWDRVVNRRGEVSESVLRAFEAWLLTAARHGMPVIFTFFSFVPPAFGGKNGYLDPASIRVQAKYVRAFARRFAGAPHLMYDFINEPSFCCAGRLWRVSPNYDAFDRAAWEGWSRRHCPDGEELAERYRRTDAGDRSLPALADFQERQVFEGARPLAARDYRLYGQEMFNRWCRRLTRFIRSAGSRQLLTVGQDEGACADRPNPWFHGPQVDFTSNHTWWHNDDILWDAVITKTPQRPLLIEETGIMFHERPDGSPARTPDASRNLLERKMALAFACGGAGFLQWLWKTDPFMPSDNECAVGFHHVDGSGKPELEAFRGVARFFAQGAPHMVGRRSEEVCLVLPHSLMFSVRDLATPATRRAVRTLEYRLGLPCRAVSEHRSEEARGARLIVLPCPRVLREEAWRALLGAVRSGSTLLVTGFVEADEYWRPVERLRAWGIRTSPAALARHEFVSLPVGGPRLEFTFAGDPLHRGEKAVEVSRRGFQPRSEAAGCRFYVEAASSRIRSGKMPPPQVRVVPHGRGRILLCPVPAELAQDECQTESLYRYAAREAGIECPPGRRPGLLVRAVEFRAASLYLLVSESGAARSARLRGPGGAWSRTVEVPPERVALLLVDRRRGELLASYPTRP